MQPTTPAPAVEPVELLLLAVIGTAEALAVLIAAAVALLLTLTGWRPAAPLFNADKGSLCPRLIICWRIIF